MPKRLESDFCYEPGCREKRMTCEDFQKRSSRFCVFHYGRHYHPGDVLTPHRKPKPGLDWMRQESPPYPHTQDVRWPHPEMPGATPMMEWPLVLVTN
jgi:hypothetical protein